MAKIVIKSHAFLLDHTMLKKLCETQIAEPIERQKKVLYSHENLDDYA